MRIKNLSSSKFEFSHVVTAEGKDKGKMSVTCVLPNAEFDIPDDHPEVEKLKNLVNHYPKEWVEVKPAKLSKEELKQQLKEREAEEKAKADAEKAAKAIADAEKKNGDKDK